jgi:sugar-phosphatase
MTVTSIDGVDCLLFDLDGVLVDSEASIERAWRAWARSRDIGWERLAPAISGRLAVDTLRVACPEMSAADRLAAATEINDRQIADADGVRPVSGMLDLLEQLPADRVGIVTGCPLSLATSRLRSCGFQTQRLIIAAEGVRRGKPDPEGYRRAAAALGYDPARCVVFEDAPEGVKAGVAASMTVVALLTTHEPEELSLAHAYVRDGSSVVVSQEGAHLTVLVPGVPDVHAGNGDHQPGSGGP